MHWDGRPVTRARCRIVSTEEQMYMGEKGEGELAQIIPYL